MSLSQRPNWNKEKLLSLIPMVRAVQSRSKDVNTKVGALIIDEDYTVLSNGYNGLPRKVDESVLARHWRLNEEKYYWYEHAERNALYNAIRTHSDIRGGHMIVTSDIPCCDCARGIIQAMQKSVILLSRSPDSTGLRAKWDEHGKRSLQMFEEVGIDLVYIDELS